MNNAERIAAAHLARMREIIVSDELAIWLAPRTAAYEQLVQALRVGGMSDGYIGALLANHFNKVGIPENGVLFFMHKLFG